MKLPRAALLVSAFFLLISCGGDGGGGTGGNGGSGSGGAGGAHGGSSGGGASGSTGSGGSAGATGSGGAAGGCQACVSCVTANCASEVTTCRANTGCNMIYQCANACTTSIQTCISNNITAAQAFASSVYPCIMSHCNTQCMY